MSVLHSLYKTLRFSGGRYQCIVCGARVKIFFRFSTALEHAAKSRGFVHDFRNMETLNYDLCNCPFCLASDRERFYMIFLEKHFGADLKKEFSVLDFAPTLSFSKKMRSFKNVKYTSTDISRDDVDVRMDVENMSTIKDNAFDVIIFSHVLEHVSSPPKALSELHRVLSPDGVAIIMVPLFHSVETTLEAKGETSVEERLRLYGQDDHVRLYAKKDFLAALQGANFKVAQKRPTDFDPTLIAKNAIADDSVLYLCKR